VKKFPDRIFLPTNEFFFSTNTISGFVSSIFTLTKDDIVQPKTKSFSRHDRTETLVGTKLIMSLKITFPQFIFSL